MEDEKKTTDWKRTSSPEDVGIGSVPKKPKGYEFVPSQPLTRPSYLPGHIETAEDYYNRKLKEQNKDLERADMLRAAKLRLSIWESRGDKQQVAATQDFIRRLSDHEV